MFGTEEQKQKYLVPLAKGEKLGAFGLTEPSAGTDASMQQTTAVLDGDEYVLNGTKVFITNAGYADTYVIIAMTDKSLSLIHIYPMVIVSTASPYKFTKDVMTALDEKYADGDAFALMKEMEKVSGVAIPAPIRGIETREIRHKNVCEKDGIADFVKGWLL